ncbi:hypothetical protein NFI96_027843 [Prochilodus magdalenae]|nr:hypothetical protein NFI96_027843 [Prochilodus magdalenae]
MDFQWIQGICCGGTWSLLLLLISISLLYGYWSKSMLRNLGIPGPRPLPFFGSMLEYRKGFHGFDMECFRKYGRVWGVYDVRQPVICAMDREVVRTVLIKECYSLFTNRRDFGLNGELYDALTIVHDEDWKRIRSILSPSFTSGRLKELLSSSFSFFSSFSFSFSFSFFFSSSFFFSFSFFFCSFSSSFSFFSSFSFSFFFSSFFFSFSSCFSSSFSYFFFSFSFFFSSSFFFSFFFCSFSSCFFSSFFSYFFFSFSFSSFFSFSFCFSFFLSASFCFFFFSSLFFFLLLLLLLLLLLMFGIMKTHSSTLLKNLQKTAERGGTVRVKEVFGPYSMDVVTSTAFSVDIDSLNNPSDPFVTNVKKLSLDFLSPVFLLAGPPQDPHRAGMMLVEDHSQHCSHTDVVVRPVGSVLWAASYAQHPVGCVLWVVSYGQCPMGSVLWAASYGQRPMGSVLWAASHGQGPVGSTCVTVSCGARPVGRHPLGQRPVGQRPVGSVLWASVLWGSVLWAASCGQHPVPTDEGLEDDQHCTVQQQMSYPLFPVTIPLLEKMNFAIFAPSVTEFFFAILQKIKADRLHKDHKVRLSTLAVWGWVPLSRVDFLQLMIDSQRADPGEGGNQGLSDHEILSQAMVFIFAGYETSSNTLSFFFYNLATNPEVMRKLQGEVDRTFPNEVTPSTCLSVTLSLPGFSEPANLNGNGNPRFWFSTTDPLMNRVPCSAIPASRIDCGKFLPFFVNKAPVQYDALMNMDYLDATLNESMRLYPVVPRVERVCKKTVEISGLTIPKGTVVVIPTYALHHDPEYWPDPETFDPERFTKENKGSIDPYVFMPFGAGPRNCIGMRFALVAMKLAIAETLQRFDISVCDETQVPLVLGPNVMLAPTKPVTLRFTPRAASQCSGTQDGR